MDGAAAAAQSGEVMAHLLQQMSSAQIETAEKLIKVNAEIALGAELGKGGAIDLSA
jgi:hypothetical protein